MQTKTAKRIAWSLVFGGATLMTLAATDARAEIASWYGSELAGNPTASGEPFNPDALTAAHKTLPLGSKVWVSNGSRSVLVTVNDRGPYTPGRDIDLSRAAAQSLGISGVGAVNVEAADVTDEIKKPSETLSELPRTGGPGR